MKAFSTLMAVVALATLAPVVHASTIERTFTFSKARLSLVDRAGVTEVAYEGGLPETRAGRPDLPAIAERVEIPVDMKVVGVEVVAIETDVVAAAARLPAAIHPRPGLGPVERTAADPAYFKAGFQPERAAELGYQGFERGRKYAYVLLSPARWDPGSGRLERVEQVRVRLTLEPAAADGLVRRERIVAEWEDGPAPAPQAGVAAPRMTSLARRDSRAAQPFKPTQVPSVLGSPIAYLIVTNDELAPEFQRLADWKTQSGFPAAVRTISFIRQNYPFGVDDADRVRQFIRDAYARWGTKWVLLGGDTDVVPTRLAYTTFYGTENIATDLYFSCLDGNWNADNDSTYGEGYVSSSDPGDDCDLMPEVYVGRAPASTLAQAQLFVNKTFQYTRTPVGDYEFRQLYFAEVLFPQDWQPGQSTSLDGAELVEEILPYVGLFPCIDFTRLYQNHLDPRWLPGAFLETKQTVIDSLNTGYNMAIHVGHGYRNVMSVGDASLQNVDMMGLANGNRLTNLYAANCTSNAIDFPCIGEAFLHAPNGGGVTNVGSTRFDFPTAGRAFQREYFRLLYEDSINAVGEAQALQKVPFVGFSAFDGVNRWTEMTLLLLGDPELRIWGCAPRNLSVAGTAPITIRDTTVTVTVTHNAQPVANARVTLYKANDEYRVAMTNGAGQAVLDFRPDTAGSASLVVTAFDFRPFQGSITVNGTSQPLVAEQAPTIDDDNSGGTTGNGNGIADAGETIDLRIPIRNNGGAQAMSVNGVLSTTDPNVTLLTATGSYGNVNASTTANGPWYRLRFTAGTPDQREVPLTLSLFDSANRRYLEKLQLTVRAPELKHFAHVVAEQGGGNGNSRPDPGETVNYSVRLLNLGTGIGNSVSAVLRRLDGHSTVTDSTASFGTVAAGAVVQGDPFTFSITNSAATFELRVFTQYGLLDSTRIDVVWPTTPNSLILLGSQTSIKATWNHNTQPDIIGYNIYRSTSAGGPFTQVNLVPTDSSSAYEDPNLQPLTRYYYQVSAVDASGNESAPTAAVSGSTNPPNHTVFPIPLDRNTPASVAVARIYGPNQLDIVAGGTKLFLWHADGTAPVDADGSQATSGDFSLLGDYFAAGPSVANLDGTGPLEVVGTTFNDSKIYAFDSQGQIKAGWPFNAGAPIWSCAALGDFDANGTMEMVVASLGSGLLALRSNGTEWIDGDANAGTPGVFANIGAGSNFGPAATAAVNGASQLDIVYAAANGVLHAWRSNGTALAGFPVTLGGSISSSAAIGFFDGAGDVTPDIVINTANGDDSLYVIKPDGGRRTGFPKFLRSSGTSKAPSPALADINNDGFTDIVVAGTDGRVYVYDRNGVLDPNFTNVRYSTLLSSASESSPVVSDINGDGVNDIVIGDEHGSLNGFGGNGQQLAGFPIQLEGEVRGAPALCDCDGDGMTEIVLSGWDAKLHMWDYDFAFSPGQTPPWPQFHHDAMRTGFQRGPALVDAPPPATAVQELSFSAPWPNPSRGARTRLNWAIPADRAGEAFEVAVFDLEGRRVRELARGTAAPGRFSAEWDLRAANGSAHTGIYFVRLAVGGWQRAHKLIVLP